ncbi:protein PELOTA 1-like [Quercus lobata]|uniref:protein PELOTA 1-like n=1 Tax=Quercus lobata TaxID=97700 RepID=UPI001247E5B2|nr:protein PELOTA 1-like [Quercus lobata]
MASSADLAVVLMQQQGLAHVFLVGKRVTTLCAKINGSTSSSSNSDNTIRCVVIGSPGCVKDEFRGYLLSEAQRLKLKPIEDNKSRIVVATTSPSNTHNLSEVLNDNAVINLIRETNVVPEIRVFKEFLDMLTSNTDRACYGPKSVETAREMLVIETLLIIDDLSGALRLR